MGIRDPAFKQNVYFFIFFQFFLFTNFWKFFYGVQTVGINWVYWFKLSSSSENDLICIWTIGFKWKQIITGTSKCPKIEDQIFRKFGKLRFAKGSTKIFKLPPNWKSDFRNYFRHSKMIETTFDPQRVTSVLSACNGQFKDRLFPAGHFRYQPDDTISMSSNPQKLHVS